MNQFRHTNNFHLSENSPSGWHRVIEKGCASKLSTLSRPRVLDVIYIKMLARVPNVDSHAGRRRRVAPKLVPHHHPYLGRSQIRASRQ